MLRAAAIALLCAGLCGCTTPEPEVREGQRMATIAIASMPPGMVVELNDQLLGVTPLKHRVPVTDWGDWSGSSLYVLRCSTPENAESETKMFYPNEKPPTHVLFRLPYAMQRYRANQQKVF